MPLELGVDRVVHVSNSLASWKKLGHLSRCRALMWALWSMLACTRLRRSRSYMTNALLGSGLSRNALAAMIASSNAKEAPCPVAGEAAWARHQ